tara:strand:+ start:1234 stop:2325 length:1092 start_codon:yes stop_codon:yes gene_type:complete
MNWEKITLAEICSPKQWKTISSKNLKIKGYPVYGANGKIGFTDQYNHEKPTILVTCRGATCGSINITEPYSYTNGNAMALDSLNENIIDLNFLKYFLIKRGFKDIISGSAQPQIIRQNILRVKIPLPPIHEQRRIAKILDSINSLRNKTSTADKNIEKLINSHFLKEVEKTDSENIKLGKIIDFITSGGRGWSKYFAEQGKYFIRVADVINETIKIEKPQFVIPPNNAEAKRTKTEEGDVVLSITGSVGRSAVVSKKYINSFISQHIALIRLDKNILIPDYLVLLLSTEKFGQSQIKKFQYGQTKPGLNFEQISSFIFPIPSIKNQKRIIEEINLIRKIKIKNLSKIQKIEELNKAVQEDLFK